eukprot:CAMPEP_0171300856 /NCGR_PEP_ID=MMETSP0816-20121228/9852_1 /TAXON_ID=420281 /ORGANISM="Proboscia inermis, Strain CCAP1064/1" /LENGTH=568 /DNA_ID=CAMNT_0011777859 /DNA_START=232 /DNA_END=1938 /DNA_ORIENTATION=+
MTAVEDNTRWNGEAWGEDERRARYAKHPAHDIRALRLANAEPFARGVTEYRQQCAKGSSNGIDFSATAARVFARARPLFASETDRGDWHCVTATAEHGQLVVHSGSEEILAGKGMVKTMNHQAYPGVTPVVTDDQVYQAVQYLVQTAAAGGKSTLFMYGMTGSGKTYSMAGIHQRAPADLFQLVGAGQKLRLQAYELVGKKCFDLLSSAADKEEVFLRVGEDGNTHVCGTTECDISTTAELQQALVQAAGQRETSATGMNATSSRSHAVYSVTLAEGGSFMMIDLAGNEANAESAGHDKERMAEAAEINASLMAVNSCLRARATGASHVPYRDSTLTRVLRNALTQADSQVAMLVCVSPACSHLERTTCTLRNAVKLLGDTALPAVLTGTIEAAETHTEAGQRPCGAVIAKKKPPAAKTAKNRKVEAMRAMALGQLFADLKESWGGNDRATWMADGWTMIRNAVLRLKLEGLIAEEQLQLLCDEVKQQLECDEFNFAAFESLCAGLAEKAQVKVSGLVKRFRARLGLPLCPKCLADFTNPAKPMDIGPTGRGVNYCGKCHGCFKAWID